MKYIKIFCILSIISFLWRPGITAGKGIPVEESDAYPKGYYSGDPLPEKTAYLTFDDGPSEWTEAILDVLLEEKVKATFFICAYWNNGRMKGPSSFQKYKTTLQRMVREGHILGNHTAGHKMLSVLSPEGIKSQFMQNQYHLDRVLGEDSPLMTLIRPPLGSPWFKRKDLNLMKRTGRVVKNIGIVAMWTKGFDSTDSWDWAKGEWYMNSPRVNDKNPSFLKKKERVYNRIINGADGTGAVILLHDTHLVTRDVLAPVIKELKARGYVFRTMEDFVIWKYGKPGRELLGLK